MLWRTQQPITAHSLWFGVIIVGRFFYRLPAIEQDAIIAHERGHQVLHHHRTRLWWLVTGRGFWRKDLKAMRDEHEFEADAYAVEGGHAEGLLALLARLTPVPLSPHPQERIRRIRAIEGARRA
jgi:beta-lactamase regulating signal transducer with metallopeptidase domain